jgi:hypothetical protein
MHANSIRVSDQGRVVPGHYCRFADTGHSAQLRHAYRFESEKLVKTDIYKIVPFLGAILKN